MIGTTVVLQDVTRLLRFDELKNNLVATVAHEFRTPLTSHTDGHSPLLRGNRRTAHPQAGRSALCRARGLRQAPDHRRRAARCCRACRRAALRFNARRSRPRFWCARRSMLMTAKRKERRFISARRCFPAWAMSWPIPIESRLSCPT